MLNSSFGRPLDLMLTIKGTELSPSSNLDPDKRNTPRKVSFIKVKLSSTYLGSWKKVWKMTYSLERRVASLWTFKESE